MSERKVLFICHNHPAVRPGGAEAYAYELHRAFRSAPGWQSTFVARSPAPRPHPGTVFGPVDGADDEYFVFTDGYEIDWLHGTMTGSKELYTEHFRELLLTLRPDVVHFQHTLFIGFDLVTEVRRTLPEAAILYTLHEFLPICHNQGQMVRTTDGSNCAQEAPRRCHECFPAISPQTFFLRKRFIQTTLSQVDLFVAPSAFLRDRFVEWGLPAERVVLEEYGRGLPPAALEAPPRARRDRFAFFGQLSPFKGVDVLLQAMRELKGSGAAHLTVHGANLDWQTREFQERFARLLDETDGDVVFAGRYAHDQLPALMGAVDWVVVPSVWWENSPLVIQEAFAHGKPVICSDIGGMAEKVVDGVSGLHFRVGDPSDLAATIRRASETPGLWDRLRAGIPPVHRMEEHVPRLEELYERARDQRTTRVAAL